MTRDEALQQLLDAAPPLPEHVLDRLGQLVQPLPDASVTGTHHTDQPQEPQRGDRAA